MAISRFSQPVQIAQPIDPIDFGMLDQTLAYKQAKFDEGYSAVNNTVQALSNLDLIRPEDREYRDRRVAQLTDQLNGYGNVDLSDPKVTAKLQLEAQSLTKDNNLISMLSSTKGYRQYNERLEKMKQNPKLLQYYSEQNEWYDKQRISKWLNGEEAVNPVNSPTLYTDTDKKAGDILKQLAPKVTSSVNGMFIVGKEMKTQKDLQYLALETASSNPQVRQQLAINAQYVYKNSRPEDVYKEAIRATGEDIADTRESLLNYENQLKVTTLDADQKASIQARVDQLKDGVNPDGTVRKGFITLAEEGKKQLENDYLKGNFNRTEDIKQQLYTNTWSKSVSRPYIVDKETTKVNPYGIVQANAVNSYNKETRRMQFETEQSKLDREAKVNQDILQAQTQLYKSGLELDADAYRTTGQFSVKNGGNTSGNYTSLSSATDPADTSHDAIKEVDNSIENYKAQNRQLMGQATIEMLKETDRDLLAKVKPVLEAGGNIGGPNGKGKILGLSDAQIKLFSQYDTMLDDATDYNKITSNPLLSKYAGYQNQMTKNIMSWEALDEEKSKAEREVFNEMWKKGETKLTWDGFQKTIKGQIKNPTIMTYDPITGGYTKGSFEDTPAQKFTRQINNKLNSKPERLEFFTAKIVNPGDKNFNDPDSETGKYGMIQSFAARSGVIIDGINTSINGRIENAKSVRDNLDRVEKIQVNKIIPHTNQVEVSIIYKANEDDKKPTEKSGVIMQLNPEEMKSLTGRSSEDFTSKSIIPSMKNGTMVDKNGAPRYFNLSGEKPNMVGNIQYRFFNYDKDDLLMSIKRPTNNGITEIHIPESVVKFSGEGADRKWTKWLSDSYDDFYNITRAKNPNIKDKETLSKLTLEEFYKNLDNINK